MSLKKSVAFAAGSLLAVLALIGAIFALDSSLAASAATTLPDKEINTQEWQVIAATNEARKKNGVPPVTMVPSICHAAEIRANEIVPEKNFSHYRPDGRDFWTVLSDERIFASRYGENLGYGYSTGAQAVGWWMDSESHRLNVLNRDYIHLGAGYIYVRDVHTDRHRFWTQLYVGNFNEDPYLDPDYFTSAGMFGNKTVYEGTVGQSLQDLNVIVQLTCNKHGVSYMPLSDALVPSYNPKKTGEQNLSYSFTYKVKGVSRTVKVDFKVILYNGPVPTTTTTTAAPTTTTTMPYSDVPGDMNGDHMTNMTDAKILFKGVAGKADLNEQQQRLGDINGDKSLNLMDARALFRKVSGA